MTRRMRAVAETWHGDTAILIDTELAVRLIVGLVKNETGASEYVAVDEDRIGSIDVILHPNAAEPFLNLLDAPDRLQEAVRRVLADGAVLSPEEHASLDAWLSNLHAMREHY